MAGRKILNEQDARRCLAGAREWRGGLGAWARAHGVDGRSLNLWRLNLERAGAPLGRPAVPRLVELVPSATEPVGVRKRHVLHVNGVELEIGDAFDEQALVRLVRVLKSC